MNKYFKAYIAAAVLFLCFTAGAAADDVISYTKSITEGSMRITGHVTDSADSEVLLKVTTDDELVYIEQLTADHGGNFDFSFILPDVGAVSGDKFVPGKLLISLGVMELNYSVSETIEYYGSAYSEYAVGKINEAKKKGSAEELVFAIFEAYPKLLINAAAYEEYVRSGGNLNAVAEDILNAPLLEGASGLERQLNHFSALMIFKGISGSREQADFLSDTVNQGYLGLEGSSALKLYELLKGSLGETAASRYREQLEKLPSREAFEFSVISLGLKNAVSAGDVELILKENESILGIDFKGSALTSSELLSMAGADINSLSEVKDMIDDIKNKRGSGNNGNNGGNRGNGGGGGGNGSGFPAGSSAAPSVSRETEPFTDLDGYDWAKDSIVYLYDKGIINGRGGSSFEPEEAVTREEFIKLLALASGLKTVPGATVPFTDAEADKWYYPYIRDAFAAGIIEGDDNGKFGIGSFIKREDIAVILKRLYFSGAAAEPEFEEVYEDYGAISDYALESVAVMRDKGIMEGYENNRFMPKSHATRAQAAVLIKRIMDLSLSAGTGDGYEE
ncbi:MAG: S-layer homology domain-containing protein [Clostridia bacterium]|nr:S-layer homology domain-containing protein [Clostridia bacterium]